MAYDGQEAVTLNCNEACSFVVNTKDDSPRNTPMKKFMLNKILPVAAHIVALLVGLGIIIIFSDFANL